MCETDSFEIVGMRKVEESPVSARKKGPKMPVISLVILGLIVAGCLILPFVIGKDPSYMDLMNANQAPSRQFLFGTDTMGRDIFTMIWSGGRISLFIGCVSTLDSVLSTATHFILKKYKDHGTIFERKTRDERMPVTL